MEFPGPWFDAGAERLHQLSGLKEGDLRLGHLMSSQQLCKHTCWCHSGCFCGIIVKRKRSLPEILGYNTLPPEQKKRIVGALSKMREEMWNPRRLPKTPVEPASRHYRPRHEGRNPRRRQHSATPPTCCRKPPWVVKPTSVPADSSGKTSAEEGIRREG